MSARFVANEKQATSGFGFLIVRCRRFSCRFTLPRKDEERERNLKNENEKKEIEISKIRKILSRLTCEISLFLFIFYFNPLHSTVPSEAHRT